MKNYMLLLRANTQMNGIPTPQDFEERMAWLNDLNERKIIVHPGGVMPAMPDAGVTVFNDGTQKKGTFMEVAHFLVGFLIITAKDMQEASVIAASNPIVFAGGSVEVREIQLR